jgi:hypothetical protein
VFNEISNLRHDHQLSGYPQGFTDSVINSKGSSPNREESSAYIPYVKGISEKLKCKGNHYNIRMIFKTKFSWEFTHENQRSTTDSKGNQ